MDENDIERLNQIATRLGSSFAEGYVQGMKNNWESAARQQPTPEQRHALIDPENPAEIYRAIAAQSSSTIPAEVDQQVARTLADYRVSQEATIQVLLNSPEAEHLSATQGTDVSNQYVTLVVESVSRQRNLENQPQLQRQQTWQQGFQLEP